MSNSKAPLPIKKPSSAKTMYLIAALVVAVAAVAGGLVWRSNHKAKSGSSAADSSVIPSDWAEYKAAKYGYMFNYPKTWSSPVINQLSQENVTQDEVVFSGNSTTNYSVVAILQPNSDGSGSLTKAAIQKTLAGDKKSFIKYDGGSYATGISDTKTKSLGQINIFQIVNLPKLNISGVMVEVLLNPSGKCAGSKLAVDDNNGCFSESQYTNVSRFAKSIRPL